MIVLQDYYSLQQNHVSRSKL